ncbi:MAG: hypothetical protein H6807_07525 [Planctomycetes bacterium]|nr:hypothetical protein [Planctomycetota bacterium]
MSDRNLLIRGLLLCLLVLALPLGAQEEQALRKLEGKDAAAAMERAARLPLAFMPNMGQSPAAVRYESRGFGGVIAFTPNGVALTLPVSSDKAEPGSMNSMPIGIRLIGAREALSIEGRGQLPTRSSFFYGSEAAGWKTGVVNHDEVVYVDAYAGIDLLYNGTQGRLKGTWFVDPGVDPSVIAWRYEGVEGVQLDATGNLVVALGEDKAGVDGKLIEEAPVAWQMVDGKKVAVKVAFKIDERGALRFDLGDYDHDLQLVIDPVLIFSTFMGGNGTDHCVGTAIDDNGHVYVVGRTHSNPGILGAGPGWPVTAGCFDDTYNGEIADAFLVKIDATGNFMHYNGFLGGGDPVNFLVGGGADWALDVALDDNGDVHITGFTEATNFPLTAGAIRTTKNAVVPDAFYTVISGDGQQILYSTYFGGSGVEVSYGIDLTSDGRAVIAGWTDSVDMQVTPGAYQGFNWGIQDGFIAIIDPVNGSLDYSTYYGYTDADFLYDVGVGPNDYIYVCGETWSNFDVSQHPALVGLSMPQNTIGGYHDGLFGIIDPQGNGFFDALYLTFIGGSDGDIAYGLNVNRNNGEVFVCGLTSSADFPTRNASFGFAGNGDSFVGRLFTFGSGMSDWVFLQPFGGSAFDLAFDCTAHNGGFFYCGLTDQVTGTESFWVRFGPGGNLETGDLYGGSNYDMALGIAVNDMGIAVAGYTKCENMNPNFYPCVGAVPFPTLNPIIATFSGGSGDGYVRKYTYP